MKCGVAEYTQKLAGALSHDPEVKVAILTSRAASTLEPHADYELLPIVEEWGWHERGTILSAIRCWSPDVVHIQMPSMGYNNGFLPWALPFLLTRIGVLVVQTWHIPSNLILRFILHSPLKFLAAAMVRDSLFLLREDSNDTAVAVVRRILFHKTTRFIQNASAIPAVDLGPSERQEIRARYGRPDARIVAFFGLIYPERGVDLLFRINDPADTHLVIIGECLPLENLTYAPKTQLLVREYHQSLWKLAQSPEWSGKVTITGFLPALEAARIMAAVDAVVLPWVIGGGSWSTSTLAAQAQGTFVLTTSKVHQGYDPEKNTYSTAPNDLNDMRSALSRYAGVRSALHDPARHWKRLRESHSELYRTLLMGRS